MSRSRIVKRTICVLLSPILLLYVVGSWCICLEMVMDLVGWLWKEGPRG